MFDKLGPATNQFSATWPGCGLSRSRYTFVEQIIYRNSGLPDE